jgi:hypothetical protein
MFGSGARTGLVIIHKMTLLILKDQKQAVFVRGVVVRGSSLLDTVARPAVAGVWPATVPTTSVSVFASL